MDGSEAWQRKATSPLDPLQMETLAQNVSEVVTYLQV